MKKILIILFYSVLFFNSPTTTFAQFNKTSSLFTDVVLRLDTSSWYLSKHSSIYLGVPNLYFKSHQPQEIAEIRCTAPSKLELVQLIPSEDFSILDTVVEDGNDYVFRIQFNNLLGDRLPILQFRGKLPESSIKTQQIHLLPCFDTHIYFSGEGQDIYQEEEKKLDLKAENLYNIQIENRWFNLKDFDYRITQGINGLLLQVKAHALGYHNLTLNLKSIKPLINDQKQLTYDLPPLIISFLSKPNRLEYVNVDKTNIYISQDYKYSDEIQIDYSKNFNLNKTYRIEDTQEQGGNLIAELYTIAPMANNKLLCKLRTFSLHKASDGYLFIKEDEKSRFITNFNIVEKPKIEKISIQSDGSDWTTNLRVYPGQQLEVKVEGKGLESSYFQFDGCIQVKLDSSRITDEALFYTMKVPLNIPKKKVSIFMNRKATAYEMQVKEYERPCDFDFVRINYGLNNYIPISDDRFSKPVLYDKLVKEINIQFNNSKIDDATRLNGKQYFSVEVRLLNRRNELTDIQTIQNLTVCPGENSPRFSFYDQRDCKLKSIYLNEYLRQKTYNLEPFSQIILTFKHNDSKYSTPGFTRKVSLILKRDYLFDIQFSFPTGLFIKEFNQSGVGNLTGISTSVLASISFYDPKRIGQLLPYSVGVGFLGVNAFSFANNAERDAGVVILGTINPLNRNSRFQIPIYFGGGYLIQANTAFLVFGPGIQFHF